MRFLQDHAADFLKGLASSVISVFALVSSFQQELEAWLRITSLMLAIVVSLLTAVSIVRSLNKPKP